MQHLRLRSTVQEIRHTTASTSQNPAEGGQTPEVDALLLKLEDRLETTNKEVENLQARLNAFFKAQSAGLLRHKWEETLRTWQNLQKESEDLREELVEDKYLTVYRTVSRQADDMMQSLEKIFAQCNAFVHVRGALSDAFYASTDGRGSTGNIQSSPYAAESNNRRSSKAAQHLHRTSQVSSPEDKILYTFM